MLFHPFNMFGHPIQTQRISVLANSISEPGIGTI